MSQLTCAVPSFASGKGIGVIVIFLLIGAGSTAGIMWGLNPVRTATQLQINNTHPTSPQAPTGALTNYTIGYYVSVTSLHTGITNMYITLNDSVAGKTFYFEQGSILTLNYMWIYFVENASQAEYYTSIGPNGTPDPISLNQTVNTIQVISVIHTIFGILDTDAIHITYIPPPLVDTWEVTIRVNGLDFLWVCGWVI
jgi:hypothetical protein